jgi:hypothetical protein
MLWLVVLLPPPLGEIVVTSPEAASVSSSWLVSVAMLLWELLRRTSKDEILYLPLRVESVLHWLRIITGVQWFGE